MIGATPRRREDLPLLTGAGRFLDDVRREGCLHLGVVRSLHAHARIGPIDAKAARAIPGVVAVWGAADLPEVARPLPAPYGGAHRTRPFAQPVLAHEVARYVGEPVAVVVAEDPYRLADGLEVVGVDYEVLPAVIDPARGAAPRLHDGWPDNVAVVARGVVGDVERALAESDVVVEERIRHPRLAAVPLEPRGALAYREPESGDLVLWSSTQNPYLVRDAVAGVL
ncbi:MAG TPA: molybdopterin cofactor-binding domain-containing protein, partial [Methylomirabilota bacterium]|nr:molybdopterin cofactor-binding domain-containing protein [Methylomirabilota bacterium]